MSNPKIKRVMLSALMITLLFSLTGCFIQPIPVVESQAGATSPSPTPPAMEVTAPIPTIAPTGDYSAWATHAPLPTATPLPTPESTAEPDETPAPGSASAANVSSPTSTALPGQVTQAVLREKSEGQPVRELQQRLKDLGYYTRAVDGSFGPATTAALKDFQKTNGLSADGIAGPKTMELLYSGDAKVK